MTTRSSEKWIVEAVYAVFFVAAVTAVFFLPRWTILLFFVALLTISNVRQRSRS